MPSPDDLERMIRVERTVRELGEAFRLLGRAANAASSAFVKLHEVLPEDLDGA